MRLLNIDTLFGWFLAAIPCALVVYVFARLVVYGAVRSYYKAKRDEEKEKQNGG